MESAKNYIGQDKKDAKNSPKNDGSKRKFGQNDSIHSKNNRKSGKLDSDEKNIKKPFNKREWRMKKYSKKFKLQQWEEKRKKSVLKEFYTQVKDFDSNPNDANKQIDRVHYVLHPDLLNDKTESINDRNDKSKYKRPSAFKAAKLEYERIKREKQSLREDIEKKKVEKAKALEEYQQKKMAKNKILFKKTKRGQPVMKGRLEMLYEQIKASVGQG